MIASMFLLGWCLTVFWVPRLGDIYGRKKLFSIGLVCDVLLLTSLLLANSLNVLLAIMLILGMITSLRTNVGYILLMELTPKKG